jgi:hypothetical protein
VNPRTEAQTGVAVRFHDPSGESQLSSIKLTTVAVAIRFVN